MKAEEARQAQLEHKSEAIAKQNSASWEQKFKSQIQDNEKLKDRVDSMENELSEEKDAHT